MANLAFAMKLPEAWRLLRISWRPTRALGVALLSLIVCGLIVFFAYSNAYVTNFDPAGGASWRTFERATFYSAAFTGIMVYQCILWLIALPVQVGGCANAEFQVGTWIFQQTAPQSARRLLLGKLLGGGGDAYTAAAVAAPFAFVFMLLARLPVLNVAAGVGLILVLSLSVASILIFFSFVSGRHHAALIYIAMFGIILFALYSSSTGMTAFASKSVFNLMELISYACSPHAIKHMFADTCGFYGMRLGRLALAVVFFGCLGGAFYLAAEAQALRLMNTPRSRVLLVPMFALAVFFFLGFAWLTPAGVKTIVSQVNEWYSVDYFAQNRFIESMVLYLLLMLGMAYGVILLHARPMNDMRPWLYSTRGRRFAVADLFDPGSPVVFTVAPLLVVAAAGVGLLVWNYSGLFPYFRAVPSLGMIVTCVILPFAAIVLRDALFFQAARIRFPRGLVAIGLIYIVAFFATSLIVNVGYLNLSSADMPLLDLSPGTALVFSAALSEANAQGRGDVIAYLWRYIIANLGLAALFGAYAWKMFRKEKQKLDRDMQPGGPAGQ